MSRSFTVFVLIVWVLCAHGKEDKTESEEPKFDVKTVKQGTGDCERKSGSGDRLTVHYKGTLLATGEEFDSR